VIHASCLGDAIAHGKVCLQTLSAGRLDRTRSGGLAGRGHSRSRFVTAGRT
jgi:hypothetical protein